MNIFTRLSLLLSSVLLCLIALQTGSAYARTAQLLGCESQRFPFIFINILVQEEDGALPTPVLTDSDFICFENNTLQDDLFRVNPPEQTTRLADIVILVDTSGSMGPEIGEVRNNITNFSNLLVASSIDFRLGLVRFGNGSGANPFLFNGGNLTDDVALFQSFVNTLRASGGFEPGFRALRQAVLGFNFRPGAQTVFILISDEDSDDRNRADTDSLLLANDVVVHTAVNCNFGTSNADYCNETSVRGITGGLLFPITGSFEDVIDAITEQLGFYEVSYRSTNPLFDGMTRTVECSVTGVTTPVSCQYVPGAAPTITRTPETIALSDTPQAEGSSISISARVTDGLAPFVQTVTLFVRESGTGGPYQAIPMTNLGMDLFEAEVGPLSTPGLDYFFRASDGEVTSSLPSTDPGVVPFQIAVLPNAAPEILHTPVTEVQINTDLIINADVSDQTNKLEAVELNWRPIGTLLYNTIPMSNIGGSMFSATIPSLNVQTDIEYFIRAVDDLGVASLAATPDDPFVVTLIINQPPVAECRDVTVPTKQGVCTADVASVDNGSSDPDSDPITLDQSPTGPYSLGATTVTLTVTDDSGASDSCTAIVTVVDEEPPSLSVSLTPDLLWPPNHKMVSITPTITAEDNCTPPEPVIALDALTMDEGDETNTYDPAYDTTPGDGNTVDDIQVDADGNISLRAERSGTGDGRIYTITYTATDSSGNTSQTSATVTVPHDQP